MSDFKDTSRVGVAATVALYAYMVLDPIVAILPFIDATPGGTADLVAIPWFAALLSCFVLVGRWIYRTNANAHSFSGDMTISPAWSVGWFFVPFANLVMPYQGVKETWRESHEHAGFYDEADSSLLNWWWGLWIATNILANVSVMFGGDSETPLEGAIYIDLLASALNVPLCLILARMIRRLSRVQLSATDGSIFA